MNEEYMQQSVRTTRASTMARINNQLNNVGQSIHNMKKALAASVVLMGAVFGLTLAANNISKDMVSNNGVLVDKASNDPIRTAPVDNRRPLGEMSLRELKKLHSVEFIDDEDIMNVYRITGLRYDPDNTDSMVFITDHGQFGLDSEGQFSPVVSNDVSVRRKLLQTNEEATQCQFISIGRTYGYWSPVGCNNHNGSSGNTGGVDPLTAAPPTTVFGNSIEVVGKEPGYEDDLGGDGVHHDLEE